MCSYFCCFEYNNHPDECSALKIETIIKHNENVNMAVLCLPFYGEYVIVHLLLTRNSLFYGHDLSWCGSLIYKQLRASKWHNRNKIMSLKESVLSQSYLNCPNWRSNKSTVFGNLNTCVFYSFLDHSGFDLFPNSVSLVEFLVVCWLTLVKE